MNLTEEQAFKIFDKVLEFLGIEIVEKESVSIGKITKQERADFVMLNLLNIK